MSNKEEEKKKKCNCDETCDCGCNEGKECHCGEEHHHEHSHTCDCGCEDEECGCGEPKITEINLDYLDIAQRLKAEFDNYKKRNVELAHNSYNEGVADAVAKILPIIDGFDQAKKNITDKNIIDGINMLYNQFVSTLTGLGVEKIECVGKEFDPNLHNAVFAIEEGDTPNIVLEEFQAGYKFKGKVLRHSVVKISK